MDKLKLNDIELVEGEIPEFEEIDTPILHKRFEKQVVEKVDDVALVAGDVTLTYGELNEKSNLIVKYRKCKECNHIFANRMLQ